MLDGIPVTLPQLGGWSLFILGCVWLVRALMRGDLVPRKTVDLLYQAIGKREKQVDELVDKLGTAVHFIEEVAAAAQETTTDAEAGP